MTNKSRKLTVLFLAFGLLAGAGVLRAQGTGVLKGKIIDANEKLPLPIVRVSVQGARRTDVTGPDGLFEIPELPAGVYKVTFELAGFITETRKDVAVTAGQTTQLDVVMRMGFANEVTVTARREVESLQNVPQNITVLTATKLAETPQVNVVAALNNVSGVDVATGSGSTTLGTFMFIDGYDDTYVRKMVDGVDVGEVVNNWSSLNGYPEEMIEQVEVVKGGSSSVWGSNMGGIINVITRRPRNMARPEITLKSTYSHFGAMNFAGANAYGQKGDNINYAADIIGNIKKFGYMLGYNGINNDGFAQYGREKNYSLFGKFSYDFSDRTYIDSLFNLNHMNTQNWSFLYLPDFLGEDFPYYWNYRADYRMNSGVASMRLVTNIGPAFNLESQLKFSRSVFNGSTEYVEGSMFQPEPGTVDTNRFAEQKTGFTVKGSYNPSESFSLVSGADYYRIMADFTGYIADQPIIYVDTVAPFVNAEYRIGPVGLHAGARYDYDSSFGDQLSPSIGITVNFLKATLIRFNVARTFKVPPLWYTLGVSYYDMILPNPDLKPERAWAYSAGIESQELRYFYVKLSGYYHKMTDGIVRVPADIEGRYTWGNISKFLRQGYEAEVGFLAPFGLTGYVGTNYNKHEDTTGEEISILTWIPTRTYKTGLKYKNDKWDLLANIRGRWIWWNMDEETALLLSPQDKKWIFDLRLAKGFAIKGETHLSVILDVFNLTNQAYWDRSDMPNPRRWGQIGLELQFK